MNKRFIIFIILSLYAAPVFFLSSTISQEKSGEKTKGGGPDSHDLFNSIQVVVGPSGKALEPVAVTIVECSQSANEACESVSSVIASDLNLSGFFKILDPASFIASPEEEKITKTDFNDWFNVGAKYLIKVKAVKAGKKSEKYDLDMRLFNVVDRTSYNINGQSIASLEKQKLRGAAHRFVNEVLLLITGIRGIFDTTILYTEKISTAERIIMSTGVDGYGATTIIANGSANMFPKWAPHSEIIYTSFFDGKPAVFVGKTKLTNDGNEYRSASFSPDGKIIAASVDLDGQSDIVLLDPKTGEIVKKLTDDAADDVSPSWSPDGSFIAFMSTRSGKPHIFVMNADGSNQKRLTMAGSYNTSPDFGKNGLIAFTGMDDFVTDIFTVDLSGNMSRLTQNQGSNKDPSWSPDYRYIAFISDRDGRQKIFIMTSDGRYQFPITKKLAHYATPCWGH
jgi:TolB protein